MNNVNKGTALLKDSFVKRPYLVDPSVSVLVEHGEGDLEPGQRLDKDRQQEEVLAA